jgi:hypothetical protein
LDPINRSVPTTITRITASITAYSAISCPSSSTQNACKRATIVHLLPGASRTSSDVVIPSEPGEKTKTQPRGTRENRLRNCLAPLEYGHFPSLAIPCQGKCQSPSIQAKADDITTAELVTLRGESPRHNHRRIRRALRAVPLPDRGLRRSTQHQAAKPHSVRRSCRAFQSRLQFCSGNHLVVFRRRKSRRSRWEPCALGHPPTERQSLA